jgi:hypothetical protein
METKGDIVTTLEVYERLGLPKKVARLKSASLTTPCLEISMLSGFMSFGAREY